MNEYTAALTDNLFSAVGTQWAGLETLANQALSSGIDKYHRKDYAGAAQEFKRAFGLSPYSSFAYEATQYGSMAYQALGETEKAIGVYKQAIKVNPTDDRLRLDIGNLFFGQNRFGEAIESYEEAVRLYDDGTNRFSLGQAYLKSGRYGDAENQFEKIIQRGGLESRNGYFGLGQAYRTQKKYDAAVAQFERAIGMDKDFYSAYAEMGYTHADAGDMDKARQIQSDLESKDPASSAALGSYIFQTTRPEILFAYADSSFKYFMKPKSPVSALDDYLANAGASKTLAIKFQFNKGMDRESVENIFNWTIKRSTESAPGSRYNNGLAVESTEVSLAAYPVDVFYDEKALSATLRFNVTQNENADATIDPSHLVFTFKGIDIDGNAMNPNGDQYMGFTGSF